MSEKKAAETCTIPLMTKSALPLPEAWLLRKVACVKVARPPSTITAPPLRATLLRNEVRIALTTALPATTRAPPSSVLVLLSKMQSKRSSEPSRTKIWPRIKTLWNVV